MDDSDSNFDQRYGALYKEMELILTQSDQEAELKLAPESIAQGCLKFISHAGFDVHQPACLKVNFFKRNYQVNVQLLNCYAVKSGFNLELKITAEIALKARILLQLAQIVTYRKEMIQQGRRMDIDEAATEWVAKNAADFALQFDKHISRD